MIVKICQPLESLTIIDKLHDGCGLSRYRTLLLDVTRDGRKPTRLGVHFLINCMTLVQRWLEAIVCQTRVLSCTLITMSRWLAISMIIKKVYQTLLKVSFQQDPTRETEPRFYCCSRSIRIDNPMHTDIRHL